MELKTVGKDSTIHFIDIGYDLLPIPMLIANLTLAERVITDLEEYLRSIEDPDGEEAIDRLPCLWAARGASYHLRVTRDALKCAVYGWDVAQGSSGGVAEVGSLPVGMKESKTTMQRTMNLESAKDALQRQNKEKKNVQH